VATVYSTEERTVKDLWECGLVDQFWRAENQLLQVLLTRFTLRREGTGVHLLVAFDEETPTVWSRDGKTEVLRWMEKLRGYRGNVERYQKEIDAFGDAGSQREYVFDNPGFPFRYVSGGTLPVIRMGGTEYYALFYRDVFPIGWNLSNGGSDTREELLQPAEAIERELREELMVVAAPHKARYVFASEAGKTLERSEYAVARRLWEKEFRTHGYPDFAWWNELIIPLKWMEGPDCVEARFAGAKEEKTSNCYVTITARDFGIEVDRIAKMTIDEDATLLDGEVLSGASGSRLLNRPVGLFEVESLNDAVERGKTCFLPDRYFYGVPDPKSNQSYYEGAEWRRRAVPRLREDIEHIRTSEQVQEFDDCQLKFDLCPVTKRMIQKLVGKIKREDGRTSPPDVDRRCEVFISYGRGDEQFAEAVNRFVRDRLHRRTFFNAEGMRHSHFRREIEHALEESDYFLSVGSSIANLRREWPTYECQVFHNDMLNGNKPRTAQIISVVANVDPRYLPLPQRIFQAIQFDSANPRPAFEMLARYIEPRGIAKRVGTRRPVWGGRTNVRQRRAKRP